MSTQQSTIHENIGSSLDVSEDASANEVLEQSSLSKENATEEATATNKRKKSSEESKVTKKKKKSTTSKVYTPSTQKLNQSKFFTT